MNNSTRNVLIIGVVIVVAGLLLDPNFSLRVLGTIQSISFIILAWVAIVYLLKRINSDS